MDQIRGTNDSWKTAAVRNAGKQQLMDAIRKAGKNYNFNFLTIENNICVKAKSLEEYRTYVERIVQKMRSDSQQQQQQQQRGMLQSNQDQHIQQQLQQQNMQQQNIQQQSLQQQNIQQQNIQQPSMQQQNLQQQNLQQQNMQQQSIQQTSIQQQNMQQQNLQQQNIQQHSLQQQNLQQQNIQQQSIQQQNIPQQNLQQHTIQQQSLQQQNMQQPNMQSQSIVQDQESIYRAPQQGMYQTTPIQRTPQHNVMQGSPSVQMRGMAPSNSPMSRNINSMPSPQSTMGYQRMQWTQSPGSQYGGGQFIQPRPPPPNMQPILTMPDSNGPHSNAIPSLSPNHPSPQINTTSPGLRTPGSVQAAQSPGPGTLTIHTIPSPVPANASEDDREYMEKLKQLQKYIEPLSRMINKFNEDEEKNNNDLSKMKTLRDTLMNPKKRLPMSLLDKCEKVLQNWLDQKPSQPTLLLPRADQHMCQPILNVIATATKSPLLNHTLKRTFGPAMKALCGNYTVPDFLPNKRRRLQDAVKDLRERKSANRISEEVKREIAGLDPKFNVKMDESNPRVNGNIQLLCYLNDPQLPALPPLQIVVPPKYPQQAAEWVPGTNYSHRDGDVIEEDDKSLLGVGFLARLRPIIRNRMTMMNKSSSTISSMLQEWSSSAARATNAIA